MKTEPLYRIAILLSFIVCFTCSKDSTKEDTDFDPELYTYVPDDNFEDFLIEKGYDNKMDNYVLTSNIENIEELHLDGCVTYACVGRGISDLTGLQDFRSLKFLNCRYNNLTTLDVSKNTALMDLLCSDNNLTKLDVSNNMEFHYLNCIGNNIECIQVNQYQLDNYCSNWIKDLGVIYSLDCNYY